jgi:polyhydroxyalkanoate synthesis regulator phasin
VAEGAPNGGSGPSRRPLEQTLLAALGWAALTVEGVDDLADDLARRVGLDRDAMRKALSDALTAWRHEGARFGARRGDIADGVVGRLGVAQKADVDDLALRVAQLEHRLKLLERD